MVIPTNCLPEVLVDSPDKVGLKAKTDATANVMAAIAVANYRALSQVQPALSAPALVAWIRATIAVRGIQLAVRNGRYYPPHSNRSEIVISDADNTNYVDAQRRLNMTQAPLNLMVHPLLAQNNLSVLGTLLPVFASIEFQKTNHHYVDNPTYKEAYARHFSSCLLSAMEPVVNKADVIYNAVHWMGVSNMWQWSENMRLLRPEGLPRGIVLKMRPTPAGTAIIKSQLAVWRAMASYPPARPLLEAYATQIQLLEETADLINQSPTDYHVFARLFGSEPQIDTKEFQAVIQSVSGMAAVAQAFLDTIASGTDLARMKALKKHSEQHIGLYKIVEAGFKQSSRAVARQATLAALAPTRPLRDDERKALIRLTAGTYQPVKLPGHALPAVDPNAVPIVIPVVPPDPPAAQDDDQDEDTDEDEDNPDGGGAPGAGAQPQGQQPDEVVQ